MTNDTISDGYQLTAKDQEQLAMTDEEYKLLDWEGLKEIISENRLEDLKRVPSDLKRYITWSHRTRQQYGSIQSFVLQHRLGWTDLTARNPIPFADPSDTKILLNDWPYGLTPNITHLVVWTKSPIPTTPPLGDLTEESRRIIEEFVERTFGKQLGRENVLWFKNWASIQSVRSVEHVHVLVRDAPRGWVEGVVGKEGGRTIGELVKEEEERKV